MSVGAAPMGLQARLGIDTSGLAQQLASGAVAGARQAGQAIGTALSQALNGSLSGMQAAGKRAGSQYQDGIVQGATGGSGGSGVGAEIAQDLRHDTAKAAAAGAAFGSVMGEAIAGAASKAVELGVGAFGAVMESGNAKAKLQAQLALSPADAARLGKVAGDVYAGNYGESVSDVNDTLKQAFQGGLIDPKASDAEIKAVAQNMLSITSAFDKDSSEVSRAVGQMLKTGLVSSAAEGLDVYTKGLQSGADKAEDLADTMNEYGVQFQKMGLDGAAATALLGQGLQAGARDGDLVADSIKEFSIRAIDGSKSSSEAYKALGLDAAKMTAQIAQGGPAAKAGLGEVLDRLRAIKDPVKQAAAATGLFGTQSEDLGKALYALNPTTATLTDVSGAAQKVNDTLSDTPDAKIQNFKRTMEQGLVGTIGGQVIPALETMGNALGLSQDSIGPLLAIALPLGGALLAGATAMKIISAAQATWNAITTIATGVQWAWNAAMNANPIGLIILAIAALTAGFIYAYKHSETFRNIVNGALGAVANGAKALWGWMQSLWDKVSGFFSAIPGYASKGLSAVGSFFTSVVTKGAEFVKWWYSIPIKIGKAVGGLAKDLYDSAGHMISGFVNGIKDGASTIISTVKRYIGDAVPDFLKGIWDIHSPSRVAHGIASFFGAGVAGGVEDSAHLAIRAAGAMADDVTAAMVLTPPTVAGVEAQAASARASQASDLAAMTATGGGSKVVQFTGETAIYTGTPQEFIDEQTESERFSALTPTRG